VQTLHLKKKKKYVSLEILMRFIYNKKQKDFWAQ
jgi:hypothetical protein